jgi:hypothetical protein
MNLYTSSIRLLEVPVLSAERPIHRPDIQFLLTDLKTIRDETTHPETELFKETHYVFARDRNVNLQTFHATRGILQDLLQ